MPEGPCNAYELNQAFIDATEFLDQVILDRSQRQRRLYIDMIPRGVYPLGEGLVRTAHRFWGAIGDQAALTTWRNIQTSRPASGQDPGYDSCRYESDMIDYAFETVQYTGYETTRRTRDVCLNDIKWRWQFQQQLRLIFGGLADVTLSIWENFGREMYLKYCADEGSIYILAQGSPDSLPLSTTYDPFTSDEITIQRDIDISALDWSFMEWWHQYLALQAPMAAVGNEDGMPLYGLVVHPWDFDQMIREDDDLREDFRFAKPNVLIENYGTTKAWRGFSIINDMLAPRFKVKTVAANTVTLERVLPYQEEATTVGNKTVVDPDYVNAEYAMGVIFLKNVYETLIPPSGPAAPGGGTSFGVQPSLNGEFRWLNILDRCENPLGEKGYYFARFQGFSRPMEHSKDAIAFLYKRCPQTRPRLCEPCAETAGAGVPVTITAATEIIGEGEAANAVTQVEVTLAECLPCEALSELSIDYGGGAVEDVRCVMVDDSAAPTYVIAFTTAGDWVAAGTIVAGTSQIFCA